MLDVVADQLDATRAALASATEAAIATLANIKADETAPTGSRVAAARTVLETAYRVAPTPVATPRCCVV